MSVRRTVTALLAAGLAVAVARCRPLALAGAEPDHGRPVPPTGRRRRRPRRLQAAANGQGLAGEALAAGAGHRRELLLRDGRPVRERRHRQRHGRHRRVVRLEHGFDPTNKGFYQGGDLKGLLDKIDYIQGLGTTSIWLTPSFKNKAVQLEDGPSAGYHGYWVTDFTQIDPHLGTNDELATLVDAAHARGMKVYFDIITNHTADVIGYEEGARTAYVPKDVEPYRTASGTPFDDRDYAGTDSFPPLSPTTSFPYTPVLEPGEENLKVPAWLNDVTLYHNRGNTTFVDEDSYYGDFFGLDDLFTEHPTVVDGMIDIYKTWIRRHGHRRLPDRHHEARQRRVLAEVRA